MHLYTSNALLPLQITVNINISLGNLVFFYLKKTTKNLFIKKVFVTTD